MDIIEATTESLATMCSSGFIKERKLKMVPQSFEKDDDGNGHMDFVTAASVRGMCVLYVMLYMLLECVYYMSCYIC